MPIVSDTVPGDSRPEIKGSAKKHKAILPFSGGGNAKDRTLSANYVSRRIGELTRNGEELIEILLTIARKPATNAASEQVRIAAINVLWDRYLGKAIQQVDHTVGPAPGMDLAGKLRQVTDAELDLMTRLDEKKPQQAYEPDSRDTFDNPDVIDIAPTP